MLSNTSIEKVDLSYNNDLFPVFFALFIPFLKKIMQLEVEAQRRSEKH